MDIKRTAMDEVLWAAEILDAKLLVLQAIDDDPSHSGCKDLHDQFAAIDSPLATFHRTVRHMGRIVPGGDSVSEVHRNSTEIQKTIAKLVADGMSHD